MRDIRKRLARAGAASLVAAGLLGISASGVLATPGWVTEMDGQQVVPGPGDTDGFGIALLAYIDPVSGDLCWTVTVELIDDVTAVQIYEGAPGDAGTLAFDLTLLQDAFGRFKDCLVGQDQATLQDVVDNPLDYFFQVSTTAYPQGAIRGQLEGLEVVTTIHVGMMLCPEGIDTLEEATAAGAGGPSTDGASNVCAATYPFEHAPADPAYPWYVEPIGTDLDLRILPAGWSERIVTDAIFLFGNGICSPSENYCTGSGWYEWESIPAGDIDIYQEVIPEGYQFGWSRYGDGTTDFAIGDSETVSVTLDGSEAEFWVYFFNVVEPAAATPAPTAPGVSITPPPTSTVESVGGNPGSAALLVAVLLIGGLGAVAASVVRRSTRRPMEAPARGGR